MITAIKEKNVTDPSAIVRVTIYAGLIAATGLALVYLALSHIGATSISAIGEQATGGALLSAVASYLYGSSGAVILGLAIAAACLTTSIGLVSATSTYFSRLIPSVSYRSFVFIFSGFSMIVANVGLTQLILFSLPVLVMIYPMAIVLIFLAFIDPLFNGYRAVYIGTMIPTFIIGVFDGLSASGLVGTDFTSSLAFLPLMEQGVGWIVPAIIGGFIGFGIALILQHSSRTSTTHI